MIAAHAIIRMIAAHTIKGRIAILAGLYRVISASLSLPGTMVRPDRHRDSRYALVGMILAVMALSGCQREPDAVQVSERPDAAGESTPQRVQAGTSRFGLRARVSYADIEAIAAEKLPGDYPVAGEKRVCKRLLGIRVCGTALWDLLIEQTAPLAVSGSDGQIIASAPLRFSGVVGIRGTAARTLGLSQIQVSGALLSTVTSSVQMRADWCPQLQVEADYRWSEKPRALWRGKLDFDIQDIVNDALDRQLAELQPRLNDSIDCARFRQQLTERWHSYSFALDIPTNPGQNDTPSDAGSQQLHLNIVPTGFAFSGIHTETDSLGFGFELAGTTVVDSHALQPETLQLPPLRKVDFKASRTDFDLLLRADYDQLESVISPMVLGRAYSADSAAGRVSVVLTRIDLSGNNKGVTVELDFTAQLPGTRRDTRGTLFLTASPVVEPDSQQLQLKDIQLSRLIDSALWNLISTVFEGQIIAAIQRASTLDLTDHTRNLEQRLQLQLQDPARTGGLRIRANNPQIRLLGIHAETDALVARTRVSAELDIDIPLTVLKKPLK